MRMLSTENSYWYSSSSSDLKVPIGWFELQLSMRLVYWTIPLFDNKLSKNNLESDLVANGNIVFKAITIE